MSEDPLTHRSAVIPLSDPHRRPHSSRALAAAALPIPPPPSLCEFRGAVAARCGTPSLRGAARGLRPGMPSNRFWLCEGCRRWSPVVFQVDRLVLVGLTTPERACGKGGVRVFFFFSSLLTPHTVLSRLVSVGRPLLTMFWPPCARRVSCHFFLGQTRRLSGATRCSNYRDGHGRSGCDTQWRPSQYCRV